MSPHPQSLGRLVVEALNVLLLIVIGWFVLVLFKPQVHWHLQSWQYRDPAANHPSDAWFAMQRITAVVGTGFLSVLLFILSRLAPQPGGASHGRSPGAAEFPPPKPRSRGIAAPARSWGQRSPHRHVPPSSKLRTHLLGVPVPRLGGPLGHENGTQDTDSGEEPERPRLPDGLDQGQEQQTHQEDRQPV